MGTWNSGVFDNDSAADYRDELIDQIAGEVDAYLEDDPLIDEMEDIVARLAILVLLYENCGGLPPESEKVSAWRAGMLRLYDERIDNLDPDPAYKKERRRILVEIFDKLGALADSSDAS